jgi:hypothetical protein
MKKLNKVLSCILAAVMLVCCLNVQPVEAKTVLTKSQYILRRILLKQRTTPPALAPGAFFKGFIWKIVKALPIVCPFLNYC